MAGQQPGQADAVEVVNDVVAGFDHESIAAARRRKTARRMRAMAKPRAVGAMRQSAGFFEENSVNGARQLPHIGRQNAGDRDGGAVDVGHASDEMSIAAVLFPPRHMRKKEGRCSGAGGAKAEQLKKVRAGLRDHEAALRTIGEMEGFFRHAIKGKLGEERRGVRGPLAIVGNVNRRRSWVGGAAAPDENQ